MEPLKLYLPENVILSEDGSNLTYFLYSILDENGFIPNDRNAGILAEAIKNDHVILLEANARVRKYKYLKRKGLADEAAQRIAGKEDPDRFKDELAAHEAGRKAAKEYSQGSDRNIDKAINDKQHGQAIKYSMVKRDYETNPDALVKADTGNHSDDETHTNVRSSGNFHYTHDSAKGVRSTSRQEAAESYDDDEGPAGEMGQIKHDADVDVIKKRNDKKAAKIEQEHKEKVQRKLKKKPTESFKDAKEETAIPTKIAVETHE